MAYVDVSGLPGITLLAGIDPVTRDFYFSAATANTEIHPMDIYTEMRICRRLNENLRGFELFMSGNGKEPKGPGKFTERFVKQLLGTRFIPYDTTSFITITGTVITDDGQEGIACFDRSGLVNQVDINYVPPQVEVVEVATGSGVLPSDVTDIVNGVWAKALEGTYTAEQVMRIMSAALAGKASGLDTFNPVFRDLSDTKNRITATTDANGNRSAVTVDGA